MGYNKKLFILLILSPFYFFWGQSLNLGKYQSKSGSYFIFQKDGSFYYQKEENITFDINIKEIFQISSGMFTKKNNLIFLSSNLSKNKYIDSLKNKIVKIKEIQDNKNIGDSIQIKYNNEKDFIKIYICNTGLDFLNNPHDVSGCVEIKSNQKLPTFFSDNYFFRIYPNLNNFRIRNGYHINTLYIDSKTFKKSNNLDLILDIDFDILDYAYVNFENDIAIIENEKIQFKGEYFNFVKE